MSRKAAIGTSFAAGSAFQLPTYQIIHLPNLSITRSPDHGGHPIFFWLDAKISPMRIRPLLLSLLISSSVLAQDSIGKLLQEAEKAPTLEKNLRTLTDEIGG